MLPTFTLSFALLLGGVPVLESICVQAAPLQQNGTWTRTPKHTQAVVLIHGFHWHVLNASVPKAELRPWQKPDSTIVRELSKNADVFVFAYGQNVPLDVVVKDSKLGISVAQLRKLGYSDIALVGHSAGGLIARHFVEDHPDAGVTKVIQVCAPNGGSALAKLTAPKSQKQFMECLTIASRQKCLEERADKFIPEQVQFVCVVARMDPKSKTDGVVQCAAQWTADLQRQGVPAICVTGSHREVVRESKLVETLATLIREKQERWPPQRIIEAKREILGR